MKISKISLRFAPIFIIQYSIFILSGCDMKTELDIDSASFPPKLCVTAILEGCSDGSGTFGITLREGRALADFKKPRQFYGHETKTNGVIRLYEDNNLILEHAGEFDLTITQKEYDWSAHEFMREKEGYYREFPVEAKPGSTYRLEIATDDYPTVTSTSVMPRLPDVTAAIDTEVTVTKENYKEYHSLNWGFSGGSGGNTLYWTVPVQWGLRESGRNYYALEMFEETAVIEGNPAWQTGKRSIGINVGDLSKLQDNPEFEIYDNQSIDFEAATNPYDLYNFPILLMSDMAFTADNAGLTLYVGTRNIDSDKPEGWDDDTPPVPPHAGITYTKEATHTGVTLRVRRITPETFKYYRSLTLQSTGMGFFSEPANIIGNIENGYGGFMVNSVREFTLLDYYYYQWRMGY